ncbi:host cell division inhibitor Icd-like protein [Salmonella enterica subsp. enterica serovar Carrau]|nr:host cell division inhibitor Icd-like protein [Salmonella enterica subsp. enterica serovar Carrau]
MLSGEHLTSTRKVKAALVKRPVTFVIVVVNFYTIIVLTKNYFANLLPLRATSCYRYSAPHKTGAGRGNPKQQVATPDAKSVFFVVRYTRHFMAWCVLLNPVSIRIARMSTAHHAAHNGGMCGYRAGLAPSTDTRNHTSRRQRMVTLAGLPKGRPVPTCAGISTPVNVTAIFERGNSCGDSIHMQVEAAAMATVPTQSHHKFLWRFYSPRTNQRHTVIASTEAQARSRLRNPAYLFSTRIRITEGVYQVRACLHLSDGEERSFLLPDLFADHQQAENLASAAAFNFSFPGHTGQVTCEVVEVHHD